ncbi:hypothetical protein EJ08DRAFT_697831 [Tothia fuscella]|uniref:Transmembrane protein n=1 Tax=Tothia fuscella TaxID=1048955 RepID=A0A9P4TX69_9PEZI|nr:hypothetical protein EJ08DRAFT_697831 [Tothia fuscella]
MAPTIPNPSNDSKQLHLTQIGTVFGVLTAIIASAALVLAMVKCSQKRRLRSPGLNQHVFVGLTAVSQSIRPVNAGFGGNYNAAAENPTAHTESATAQGNLHTDSAMQ